MQKLKVAAVNNSDYFMLEVDKDGSLRPVGGTEYSLLKILSQAMGFEFDILTPKDHTWGTKQSDGSWTGMVGMLQRKEADVAIEQFMTTAQRKEVVDFSFPYSYDQTTFAKLNPAFKSKEFVYLYPFQSYVWLGIVISIVVLFVALLVILRQKNPERFWMKQITSAVDVILGSKNGDFVSTAVSFKIFFSVFKVSLFILTMSYTCVFLSFLLSPVMQQRIKNFQELVDASQRGMGKITIPKQMSYFILSLDDRFGRALSEELRKEGGILPNGYDHIASIKEGNALIFPRKLLNNLLHKSGQIEEMYISSDSLESRFGTVIFRKNFCCIKQFDQMLLKVLQAGLYDKIIKDFLFQILIKVEVDVGNPTVRAISLHDVAGAFYVLLILYIFSIVVRFIELCLCRK